MRLLDSTTSKVTGKVPVQSISVKDGGYHVDRARGNMSGVWPGSTGQWGSRGRRKARRVCGLEGRMKRVVNEMARIGARYQY